MTERRPTGWQLVGYTAERDVFTFTLPDLPEYDEAFAVSVADLMLPLVPDVVEWLVLPPDEPTDVDEDPGLDD